VADVTVSRQPEIMPYFEQGFEPFIPGGIGTVCRVFSPASRPLKSPIIDIAMFIARWIS
jgi:hypothetical protein